MITGARERIDALDDRIIGLIQERMAVSAVIQEARITSGGRRVNLSREMEVLGHYREALGKPGTVARDDAARAVPRPDLKRPGRVRQGRRVRSVFTDSGSLSPVRRVTGPRGRFVGPGVRASQGRARKNHAWLAGAMRRTDRAVRRGTSLQDSDRTAGDSSPVTQENGRLRGRPGPTGGPCINAQVWVKRLRAPRSSSTMRTQSQVPPRAPALPTIAKGADQRRYPPAPGVTRAPATRPVTSVLTRSGATPRRRSRHGAP